MNNVRAITAITKRELELGVADPGKSSWHDDYKGSAYVFVGGLSYDLTEGDVLSVMSQYGEIVNINLVRDRKTGKSKGFCFIGYEDQRSTVLAVDNLNGTKLCGRTVRVDHVKEYRRPKDDQGNEIIEMGCAPKTPTPSPSPEPPLGGIDTKKKKKKKDKEKKKDKKKKKAKKTLQDIDRIPEEIVHEGNNKDQRKRQLTEDDGPSRKRRESDTSSSDGSNNGLDTGRRRKREMGEKGLIKHQRSEGVSTERRERARSRELREQHGGVIRKRRRSNSSSSDDNGTKERRRPGGTYEGRRSPGEGRSHSRGREEHRNSERRNNDKRISCRGRCIDDQRAGIREEGRSGPNRGRDGSSPLEERREGRGRDRRTDDGRLGHHDGRRRAIVRQRRSSSSSGVSSDDRTRTKQHQHDYHDHNRRRSRSPLRR